MNVQQLQLVSARDYCYVIETFDHHINSVWITYNNKSTNSDAESAIVESAVWVIMEALFRYAYQMPCPKSTLCIDITGRIRMNQRVESLLSTVRILILDMRVLEYTMIQYLETCQQFVELKFPGTEPPSFLQVKYNFQH